MARHRTTDNMPLDAFSALARLGIDLSMNSEGTFLVVPTGVSHRNAYHAESLEDAFATGKMMASFLKRRGSPPLWTHRWWEN